MQNPGYGPAVETKAMVTAQKGGSRTPGTLPWLRPCNQRDQHKTCSRNFAIRYISERVTSRQKDSHRVRSPLKMHRLNQTKTVSCDQQSEYDSTPEEEDHQPGEDQEKESGVENYEMPVTPVNFLSKNNQFHSNELHCFYTLSSSNKKQRIISLITILFVSFPSRGHLSSKTLAYI